MPANTDHPIFFQNLDGKSKLWRYMDFSKFVSLISSMSLFFCRADLFSDPFEGSFPAYNTIVNRREVYKELSDEIFQYMSANRLVFSKGIREWTYINCWHANEYESAAMWNLYTKTSESIAIETTYEMLKNVLPDDAYLGCVKYIDYQKEWLREDNLFAPFIHKRKSFEHENEVRAMFFEFPENGSVVDFGMRNSVLGRYVPVHLNELVTAIHISPTAPDWLEEVIVNVCKKYNLSAEVKKSDLYSDPVFC